jgi:hypothetical protein
MKLSINSPCHENWDGMTPNEKGAFCLSCQKNVVDFSKKTIEEIKDFFAHTSKTESVCGRFEEHQLTEMTFDHFFREFKSWKYFQKAAVVVFFVFGFALFGCSQSNGHDIKMGKVAYIPPDTMKTIKPKCNKDTIAKAVPQIKGRIKTTHDPEPRNTNRPKKPKKDPPPIMGDIMIEDNKN